MIRMLISLWYLTDLSGATAQVFYTPVKLNADSLFGVLKMTKGDPHLITLVLLSEQFSVSDPDTSLYYASEAYRLSNFSENATLKLKSTVYLGLAWHRLGNYPKSIGYSLDGQRMAFSLKDTTMISLATTCVILSYLYSNNYDLAIRNAGLIYTSLRNSPSVFFLFDLNIRVGWVYMMSDKYREAIVYFNRCDSLERRCRNIPPAFTALNYRHLGNSYRRLRSYDTALIYLLKTDSIDRYIRRLDVPWNYLPIAKCYFEKGYSDSASLYCRKALDASQSTGEINSEGYANLFLGQLLENKTKWRDALLYYDKAIACGNWIIEHVAYKKHMDPNDGTWYTPEQHVPDYIKSTGLSIADTAHNRAYRLCKRKGLYAEAVYHMEKRFEIQVLADQLKKRRDVLAVGTLYETERKEEELARISRENELVSLRLSNTRFYNTLLAVALLFVILTAGLLLRNYHLRKTQETSVLKQKLLRAQLNPHFIFNALSCIQGFIIEKDHISAATYLSRFSKLVRNILISSQEEFIPVSKEIETIDHYLQLQQVRYVDLFDYSVEEDNIVSEVDIMIPSMLVQPFVENAIEHGVKHKKTKGHIKVSFKLTGNTLVIEVKDDGVGYAKARELEKGKKTGNNLSTKLIHERLGLLNRNRGFFNKKARITLHISDLPGSTPPDSGTMVTITVPIGKDFS